MDPVVVLAAGSVALGGLAQSVTGLGFALVAAPGLIALLGQPGGVSVVVLLGALSNVISLLRNWPDVRPREGVTLLVPIVVATPLFAAIAAGADARLLAAWAGLAILVGVLALWRGLRWAPLVSIPGAVATGATSAAMTVIGGVGGPPVGLYAANAGWEPRVARATLQAVFLAQGLVTLLVLGFVLPEPWMLGALVAGTIAGVWVAPRIPIPVARLALLAVAAAGGAGLIVGNL